MFFRLTNNLFRRTFNIEHKNNSYKEKHTFLIGQTFDKHVTITTKKQIINKQKTVQTILET